MATLGDYIGLALILALAYGIYLGLQHKEDAKQALKDKRKELKVRSARLTQAQGIDISSQGIAIRSNRRGMDRAAYIVCVPLTPGRHAKEAQRRRRLPRRARELDQVRAGRQEFIDVSAWPYAYLVLLCRSKSLRNGPVGLGVGIPIRPEHAAQ